VIPYADAVTDALTLIGTDAARHASYFRNAPGPVRHSGQITGPDVSFDLATGVVWKLHEPSRDISLAPSEGGPVVGERRIHTVGDDGDLGHFDKPGLSPQRGQAIRCSEWAAFIKSRCWDMLMSSTAAVSQSMEA